MKHRATEIRTLFTDIGGTHVILTAESWIQVKLRLETAGPVAVGTRANVAPVLGGGGGLVNDLDMVFVLCRGDKLYYTAQAVNRVRVVIEPIPSIDVVPVKERQAPVPGESSAPGASQKRKPPKKLTRWP